MKTAAVIAELNPCHAGHAWFLREVRRRSGADHLVVILSGDFVQRGEPAIFDKYIRTEMALACEADLILELPTAAACGSARRFAEGAVNILDSLKLVDELWFGSEAGMIEPFLTAVSRLGTESAAFRDELRRALSEGLSFPAARERSLTLSSPPDLPSGFLSQPNNILGLEYCLALRKRGSSIQPHTLRRAGTPYHSEELPADQFASAAAIRACIKKGMLFSDYAGLLPESLLSLYKQAFRDSVPVFPDDFSSMLQYQLQKETPESLSSYLDIPSDLANRILHLRDRFSSFTEFADLVKTRNRTLAQVRRALLHILLGIRSTDLPPVLSPEYVRVLGFSSAASGLLSGAQKKGQITLVTKASALSSFSSQRDVFASRLYESVRAVKAGCPAVDEYRRGVITI